MLILIYILAIAVLQTVVFSRLAFLGVIPDLVLVSAIVFAVVQQRTPATLFAAGAAFIQDLLSAGIYLNVIIKTIASSVVGGIREKFVGDEYKFAAGMVAAITPVCVLAEGLILFFIFQKQVSPFFMLLKMIFSTLYNLILLPAIFPVIKKISHAQ